MTTLTQTWNGTELPRQSHAVTGSSTDAMSSAPSAKDIDLAHQATGVPSLGAEAVNAVRGPQ